MRSRVQRLCSVTKVIQRAQQRNFTATQHHAIENQVSTDQPQYTATKQSTTKHPNNSSLSRNPLGKKLKITRYPLENAKRERTLSEVHWALSPTYKIGGKIEEGVTPKEAWDDSNDVIPRYNEDKVMIKIQSVSPATVMHL